MTRPRKWKRTLLMVLLLLTGGAIVNVAVAWGCAIAAQRAQTSVTDLEIENNQYSSRVISKLDVHVMDSNMRARLQAAGWEPGAGYLRAENHRAFGFRFQDVHERFDPACVNFEKPAIMQWSAGWPTISLGGEQVNVKVWDRADLRELFAPTPEWSESGFFRLSLQGATEQSLQTILPHWPLWPGFAINTIFYAAILWLLFYGPGKVRRFVRVRRHRCPACGFIIAPNTCANGLCSECGAALPQRMRTQTP